MATGRGELATAATRPGRDAASPAFGALAPHGRVRTGEGSRQVPDHEGPEPYSGEAGGTRQLSTVATMGDDEHFRAERSAKVDRVEEE